MPIPIAIPRLGWNADEGLFAGWLKQPGDTIKPGDRVFSFETEKATEEIEVLDGGILHISPGGPKVGDKIAIGAVIGYLLQPGEEAPKLPSISPKLARSDRPPPAPPDSGGAGGGRSDLAADRGAGVAATTRLERTSSPRARRAAHELGVDWTTLQGSGKTGRICEGDVRAAASGVSLTRRTIAERMMASARSTAPVTLTTTADATNLVKLRRGLKTANQIVPSYTDFLIKFAASALQEHPRLNCRWDRDRIVEQAAIHIGIAVDTEAGLLVPVVHGVTSLTVEEIARRTNDLAQRARDGALKGDEMRGGTFTITNLGAFGVDAFTPIINYPECAILGVGRIVRQPVVVENEIAIRDVMTLSLTFDHRIVDGAPAARFLQTLVKLIESDR